MRPDKVWAVVRREYLTRVKTRGFWISTVLIPVFMAGLFVLPTLLATRQQERVELGVVDRTGQVLDSLQAEFLRVKERLGDRFPLDVRPYPAATETTELAALVVADSIDAFVLVTREAIDTGEVEYHARVTTNLLVQEELSDVFRDVFTAHRLREAGYDDELIRDLSTPVRFRAVGIGREKAGAAGEVRFFIAYAMFFLLYMMILIYGQNIMRGVLEEKSSRIVEVVVSSLRPSELMIGKIIGIGAVGFSQLTVWAATAVGLSLGASTGVFAALANLPPIPISLVLHFLALFVAGFTLYAGIYAVIGAMHNNEQEAQQYNMVAMTPIIIPVVFVFSVINAPSSTLSIGMSLVPFFTPLLMMARIAVGAATAWQIVLGYVLLVATIALVMTFAAKIYRVGILMYGKRPTLPELARWIRY